MTFGHVLYSLCLEKFSQTNYALYALGNSKSHFSIIFHLKYNFPRDVFFDTFRISVPLDTMLWNLRIFVQRDLYIL